MLPPVIQVPSVGVMQQRRRRLLQSRDLLPTDYTVTLWHETMRQHCAHSLGQPTYSVSSIRPILQDFFRGRLCTLLNAGAILHLRRAALPSVPEGLEALAAHLLWEHERVAALLHEISRGEDAWESVRAGCRAHLRWLVHRHHVHHPVSAALTRLDWTLLARRADLLEAARAGPGAEDPVQGTHESVEFQSAVCRWAGFASLAVQPVSASDADLDRCELLPLKKELDALFPHVTDIDADDGYLFQHASYAALLHILPKTSLAFPPHAAAAASASGSAGHSFKKQYAPRLGAPRQLLVQLDPFQALSKARVDALLLVDASLAELLALASIDSPQLLTAALAERVHHHSQGLSAAALAGSPWKARGRSKLSLDPHVHPSHNKLSALYSLHVTSLRIARRRLLGLVNYALVAAEWASGLHALAQHNASAAPDAAARGVDEERVAELLRARHSFAIDEDGVVHCYGGDKVGVVYEEALERFRRLEDRLLRLATHAVKEAETAGAANRPAVLHDVFQCEVAFQEARFRYLSLLLDLQEHTCEPRLLGPLLQQVYNVAHLQACVGVEERFVAADYEAHTAVLSRAADLLRQARPPARFCVE